ncbi:MAG: MFS transporter [Pseudomonadota bacterium]
MSIIMNKVITSIVPKQYIVPYLATTTLFFFWAFGLNANDILVAHFKSLFGLNLLQASLVPTAYFTGYFLASLPMGYVLDKIGFSKTIRLGLSLCTLGALGFIAAGFIGKYIVFLAALIIMASGATALEVSANSYVTLLGPEDKAGVRINFSQSFNALGAMVTVYGLAHLLLGSQSVMSIVRAYGTIAAVFFIAAILLNARVIPDIHSSGVTSPNRSNAKIFSLNSFMGFLGILFYLGAQTTVASFLLIYAHRTLHITTLAAAIYVVMHVSLFLVGRFISSGILYFVRDSFLLGIYACINVLLCISAMTIYPIHPHAAVFSIVFMGAFNSIMYPTVFELTLRGQIRVRRVSSILVMGLVGGAISPPIMGELADLFSIQFAYIVPMVCYAMILVCALYHIFFRRN